MEEKAISHEESLALIRDMLNRANNTYYESGMGALLWGFTNIICFSLTYIDAVSNKVDLPFNPFFLMIITFLLQFYFDRKERRHKTAITFLDQVNKYVWMAFGIAVLLLTIGGALANIGYIVLPLLLLLFAIPTFITGCITKFTPFIIGAVICWILFLVALMYKSNLTYLLVALGALAAWVIPGFTLRTRFNKKNRHGL